MNGLLDAKKCGWPYPHGERREVMIATLPWAIVCRLFPMVRAFMQGGGGKFPGREILFLAASAFQNGAFCLSAFFLHYHSHSFSALLTRFQCESNKPMTSSFIDMLYKIRPSPQNNKLKTKNNAG